MHSFNISTSRGKFQSLQDQTFQIMPQRTGILNPFKFKLMNSNTNILLHTGYDFHPFQAEIFNPTGYQVQLLKSYLETCRQIKVDQLLIHGPDQPKYLKYFEAGLTILKSYLDDFNLSQKSTSQFVSPQKESLNKLQEPILAPKVLQICIEMPAFCQSMYSKTYDFVGINKNNVYDFTLSYFNQVIKFGFDIVIDTAHLYSNGLSTQEMISICDIFRDNYKYIHLNGNSKPQFKKDKHTTLTPCDGYEANLIPESDALLKKMTELMNVYNKICISEQKCGNIDYYRKLSIEYGFKLNESIMNNPDLITSRD